MTKKYNDGKNVAGSVIKSEREKQGMKQVELRRQLELRGIYISKNQLYQVEHNEVLIKDFELIAIFDILDVDMNVLKKLVKVV